MRPVDRANFQMLASLVAFPVTWAAWGLRRPPRFRHPPAVAAVAFVVGPLTGQAAVGLWEKYQDVRTAKLQWRRTVRHARPAG